MTDCLFCRILQKEIPTDFVYEDDRVVVFLDIHPVNPGHLLVVPKTHVEHLTELSEADGEAVLSAAKIGMRVLMDVLGYTGVNIIQNNYPAAGQVIPHVHFHVIPRKEQDGYHHWKGSPYADGRITALAAELREGFVCL